MNDDRALLRRCRRIAAALTIPQPFETRRFLDGIAVLRGRPIEVLAASIGPDAPCGVLVSTDRADYICHPMDTTALHAEHILFHEVAHLLCGHVGDAVVDEAAMRVLIPDLSTELVRRVLGRTGYSERQEREAELVATLIAQRVVRRPDVAGGDGEAVVGSLAQLESVFDNTRHGRDG
jgi:hypothetical protein